MHPASAHRCPRSGVPTLAEETFDKFRALIYQKTGIHMREGKQILVSNRLRKRLVQLKLASYEEYYDAADRREGRAGGDAALHRRGEHQRDLLLPRGQPFHGAGAHRCCPELFRAGGRVRIWSAGCSTGEEVYTLRIVADQAAKACGAREVEIVGTDISTTVIARARRGHLPRAGAAPGAARAAGQYFGPAEDGALPGAATRCAARVEFRVHNLFTDPPRGSEINVIFCRNVMIYFDKPTQVKLVDGIFARAIAPDGYLFIGHSESLERVQQVASCTPRC